MKLRKYERLLRFAEEAVLFAEDAFQNSTGVEKLKKAVEYLKIGAAKAGIPLSDREAEEKPGWRSRESRRRSWKTS
ncbi:MAG: phage holin, LLH family [Candidatus Caldatribacteriaceae bacterium]